MDEQEKKQLIAEMKSELVVTMKAMMPEMETTVAKSIETNVNGKINAMRRVLDDHVQSANDHREKVDEFMILMAPAADGIRVGASLRKFAVWLSGFGVIGTIAWLGLKSLIGR